jgi:hypothetical protein
MEKVITHVGLDVHAERIVIASLKGRSNEPFVRCRRRPASVEI